MLTGNAEGPIEMEKADWLVTGAWLLGHQTTGV